MFASGSVTAQVEDALVDLACADFEAASDWELEVALVDLQRTQNRLDAVKAKVTAVWDLRRVWARHRCRNGAAWLAATLRIPTEAAGRQVRQARHLRHLQLTWEALAAGEISSDHVQRIVGADTVRTRDQVLAEEASLVGWAKGESWRLFCRKIAEWVEDNDPDGPHRDRGERRRFHFAQTFQNGWATDGWFDPINGTIIHTELDRLEQQLFAQDWKAARDRLGRDPLPGELGRSHAQRRADALVEMARRSAAAEEGGRQPRPLVIILAGVEGFSRSCELLDGTVLSPSEVADVLTDADIQRITFYGEDQPVTASRQRTFTGILRRVLDVRDRWCTDPLCDEPAERCQGDHRIPYASGGPTSIDNGQLRCGHHNRLRNTRPDEDDDPP
jgi:hypothetical protein